MTAPTVGIVGGGQLARMLLPAASRLALPIVLLADRADPAARFCDTVLAGRPDGEGLRRLADRCDVLTVEHELVDLDALALLESAGCRVRPSVATLRVATDKVRQRAVLGDAGVPIAPWAVATTPAEIDAVAAIHGWPLVLKRPRGGYDGRGVFEVVDRGAAVRELAEVGGPLLVEPRLAIERELAVLVARRPSGETVVYPPVETRQVGAICREVLLPAPVPPGLARRARTVAERAASAVGAVGILAVELFVAGGDILLNELAARPHNAGHVTIEGSVTCQFENHLRAVADLPLGSTTTRAPSAMVNVIGGVDDPRARLGAALRLRDVAVHLYGKAPRPGRKLGHVTASALDVDTALVRARAGAEVLTGRVPA